MSTRASVRQFLDGNHACTSPAWRRQLADRCCYGARWPNPWMIAPLLGLEVRLVDDEAFRYATDGSVLYLGIHDDLRVLSQRLATAIAQRLLELSNAEWTQDDVFLLAFELLMPSASVRGTAPGELARCQPYAVPALVETWAAHVSIDP